MFLFLADRTLVKVKLLAWVVVGPMVNVYLP